MEYVLKEDPNEKYAKKKFQKKKKKKNEGVKEVKPQEAHEAIRPSISENGSFVHFSDLSAVHSQKKNGSGPLPQKVVDMYEMIYRRTISSLMTDKILNQTSVVVEAESTTIADDVESNEEGGEKIVAEFRASGSVVIFPGFDRAWWKESSPSSSFTGNNDTTRHLPSGLHALQQLSCLDCTGIPKTTNPPPRYNEASFVKELESKGVGRPSTYASVIETLRRRAYVGTPSTATGKEGGSGGKGKFSKDGGGGMISARRAAGGEGAFLT
eukprot:3214627-Ditylum_brightwellii.AAC.1